MANTLGIIQFIGSMVFSFGLGIAGLAHAIQVFKDRKRGKK